jgi:hypothetical protein
MTYLQASNALEDAEMHAKIQRRKTMLIEKQEKMQTEASIQLGIATFQLLPLLILIEFY